MKSIKLVLLVLAITSGSVLFASTDKNPENSNDIAKEVVEHLKNPKLTLKKDVRVFVKFTLNENHEMVVLHTNSESRVIDSYIKSRLNYKTLKAKSLSGKKTFILPLTIEASK